MTVFGHIHILLLVLFESAFTAKALLADALKKGY
jgi:hypothetical protein